MPHVRIPTFIPVATLLALGTACIAEPGYETDPVAAQAAEHDLAETTDGLPTWKQYRAEARREYDGREFFLVEGDWPVSEDELRFRYDSLVDGYPLEATDEDLGRQVAKAVINQINGADGVYSTTVANNLTYCVSHNFGNNHARAVSEMEFAAEEWERHAGVDFIYDASHDANCNKFNNAVHFAVRSWAMSGGCAFAPHREEYGCVERTLVININQIDTSGHGEVTSQGVFTHELGHILGLRHEHMRNAGCAENGDIRLLTAYDSDSVMHYPWCEGGTNTGDLQITELDSLGIDEVYPRFPGCGDEVRYVGPTVSAGSQEYNGRPLPRIGTFGAYPVYGDGTWTIARGMQGLWSINLGPPTVNSLTAPAHTVAQAPDPFSSDWGDGAVIQAEELELSGGPYASNTNGTFTRDGTYNGAPVYKNGIWSIYRRADGEWYLDYSAINEHWDGTVSHTSGKPRTPWMGDWSHDTLAISPDCSL